MVGHVRPVHTGRGHRRGNSPETEEIVQLMHLLTDTRSKERGFTLIEVMIVVIILGILAAIVAPQLMGRSDEARVKSAKVQIRNLETALKLFKLDNGFYPSSQQGLEALINKPGTGRIPAHYRDRGYLEQRSVPMDPWGGEYIYLSPGISGDYEIISLGGDQAEGGEGYDADIHNWDIQQ
jgi:general secretion pathway protein G